MQACTASSAPAQHDYCTDMQRHNYVVATRGTPTGRRLRHLPASPWSGGRPRTDTHDDHGIARFLCWCKALCPLFVPWRVDHGTGKSGPHEARQGGARRGRSGRKRMADLRLKVGGDQADNILECVCSTHASITSREETHTHVCKVCTPAQIQRDSTHAGVQSMHASAAAG